MRTLSSDISNKKEEKVTLKGWVDTIRDHGKVLFVDLRDREGIVQVVFSSGDEELYQKAEDLRSEWVIEVTGAVQERPEGMENPDIESGYYEVKASNLEVLSESKTPPISTEGDGYEIGEDVRMEYRYLDLRRKRLQENIRERHEIIKFFRDYLSKENFVEIETPILGKSTPEGARDFLVPSRLHPGEFYALPQSPQQYKQLLMVAGMEKYFQIVKCFRDEDTRGDRQPEFSQLDIEMSFTSEKKVLELVEDMFLSMIDNLYPDKQLLLEDGSIPVKSYKEVVNTHGTDRPDIRSEENPDKLAPLFVVDFPAFEYKEGNECWGAMHHPFTCPKVETEEGFEVPSPDRLEELFEEDPSQILSYQYDLVLNGYEIAGGSLRIHKPELLSTVFELLGHSKEEVQKKFGHLLEAFQYGTPPHGGIAFGMDRIFAILMEEPNIREVIAFPKTGDGRDLLMNAPSEVDKSQLDELSIKIESESGQ
ncbi:MAG: aspartate--tRNA ligase [Candidatus Magasanikbacteria bacterium]